MTDFDYAINDRNQMVIPEFEPFQKKELVIYLKGYSIRWKQLQQRQQQIMQQMRELEKTKTVNGQSENDRINIYAYGSHGGDGIGGSGNRYNPDTLFNRWLKIYYEPFEAQKKIYMDSLTRIIYEQWQMETVNRCVEMLPIEQRHLIINVYLERQKVSTYCQLFQLGHDRYNQRKEQALKNLVDSVNFNLLQLKTNWEEMHAKSFMDLNSTVTCQRCNLSAAGL